MTSKRAAAVLAAAVLMLVACGAGRARALAASVKGSLVIPVSVEFDERCPSGVSSEILVWSSDDSRFAEPVRIQVSGRGTVCFGPAEYASPGTFHYHVVQKSGGNAMVDYDSAEFEVTARVLNGSGGCLTVISEYRRKGSQGKSASIRYVNKGRAQQTPAPAAPASAAVPAVVPAQSPVPGGTGPPRAERFFPAATGDSAVPPVFLAALMCVSGAGLAVIARIRNR